MFNIWGFLDEINMAKRRWLREEKLWEIESKRVFEEAYRRGYNNVMNKLENKNA